jgi:hypothetical protein
MARTPDTVDSEHMSYALAFSLTLIGAFYVAIPLLVASLLLFSALQALGEHAASRR